MEIIYQVIEKDLSLKRKAIFTGRPCYDIFLFKITCSSDSCAIRLGTCFNDVNRVGFDFLLTVKCTDIVRS